MTALFVDFYSDGSFCQAYYFDENGKRRRVNKRLARLYMAVSELVNYDSQSGMSATYSIDLSNTI